MNIGERIKMLRKSQHIGQKELADKLGMTPTGICYWETGKSSPPTNKLEDIAKALNVSTSYLLGEETTGDDDPNLNYLFSQISNLPKEKKNDVKRFIKVVLDLCDEE